MGGKNNIFRYRNGQKSKQLFDGRRLTLCRLMNRKVPILFCRQITVNWQGIF